MAELQNIFELNTSDVLGSNFRSFTSKIKGLSLTNSSEYFAVRASLSKSLCDDIVSNLYKTVFKALTLGNKVDGTTLYRGAVVIGGTGGTSIVPGYPSQKANLIAMRLCEMLESELQEILNILMPISFSTVAEQALNFQPRANLLNPAATTV